MDNSTDLVSREDPNDKYSVDNQIAKLSKLFRLLGISEIVLADDVVFSGSVLGTIIGKFKVLTRQQSGI